MNADKAEMRIRVVGYLLDSGSPRSVERCGAGALARGRPLAGLPVGGRGVRRGPGGPLHQADTPNRENDVWRGVGGQERQAARGGAGRPPRSGGTAPPSRYPKSGKRSVARVRGAGEERRQRRTAV